MAIVINTRPNPLEASYIIRSIIKLIWGMIKLESRQRFILLLIIGLILSISQASAYIDPGTASVVWQFMLALMLGAAFTVRLYWTKIKDFSRKIRKIY